MAHPQIAVFARLADGQAAPIRRIEGQTTLLSRTMHGIAYDDVADRIIVPAQFSQAILSFRGEARETARAASRDPIRDSRADRVAVDPIRKESFVGTETDPVYLRPNAMFRRSGHSRPTPCSRGRRPAAIAVIRH